MKKKSESVFKWRENNREKYNAKQKELRLKKKEAEEYIKKETEVKKLNFGISGKIN